MKQFLKRHIPEISGVILGGIGGFLYWKYVGCISGTCAIKSNWYLMVPWGMILGYLIGALVKDFSGKKKQKEKNNGS